MQDKGHVQAHVMCLEVREALTGRIYGSWLAAGWLLREKREKSYEATVWLKTPSRRGAVAQTIDRHAFYLRLQDTVANNSQDSMWQVS